MEYTPFGIVHQPHYRDTKCGVRYQCDAYLQGRRCQSASCPGLVWRRESFNCNCQLERGYCIVYRHVLVVAKKTRHKCDTKIDLANVSLPVMSEAAGRIAPT